MTTVARASAYFVTGGSNEKVSTARATAYVVGGNALDKMTTATANVYTVLGPYPQPTEEPQTFIGT